MDEKGRENFWNVLKDIHDNTEQNVKKLTHGLKSYAGSERLMSIPFSN